MHQSTKIQRSYKCDLILEKSFWPSWKWALVPPCPHLWRLTTNCGYFWKSRTSTNKFHTLMSSTIARMSHHQFFVQKEHHLMWCKVPKAASTSWLHAFLQLANVPQHQMPEVRCSRDKWQYAVYGIANFALTGNVESVECCSERKWQDWLNAVNGVLQMSASSVLCVLKLKC